MADGPAIFKRKSSKVTGRSRPSRTLESNDEVSNDTEPIDGEDVEGTESPSVLASKLKKKARTKPKVPVTSSRLSFNDDGDEVRVFNALVGVC
jgi:GC-rich sequence DNA-binding factor